MLFKIRKIDELGISTVVVETKYGRQVWSLDIPNKGATGEDITQDEIRAWIIKKINKFERETDDIGEARLVRVSPTIVSLIGVEIN